MNNEQNAGSYRGTQQNIYKKKREKKRRDKYESEALNVIFLNHVKKGKIRL